MKIWHLDCDVDNYENLMWAEGLDIDEVRTYYGREKLSRWKPLKVKKMYNREFSNTPSLSSHIPVFDKEAVQALEDLISNHTEILPLECSEGEFYAINVTEVIDCIDYEKSEFKTYRDGQRIMRFIKYAFKEQNISEKHIFKILDEPLRRPFVSDSFRQRVIENNLTGFKFELVWDSDDSRRDKEEKSYI